MTAQTKNSEIEITELARAAFGPELIITGDDARSRLNPGVDPTSLDCGLVALPRTVGDIQNIVKWCVDKDISIVTHGGRTGVTGATSTQPGQMVLDTRHVEKNLEVDPASGMAVVSAGITLAELEEAAAPHGLHPGIEIGSRSACTVGGLISTNAGGAEVFRYGMMRQRVVGLEAVLADGSLMVDMPLVRKSNMGIDVKQLLIGGEGTLGIITKAVLKLVAIQPYTRTLMIVFDSMQSAVDMVGRFNQLTNASVAKADFIQWKEYIAKCLSVGNDQCLTLAHSALASIEENTESLGDKDLFERNPKDLIFVIAEFDSSCEPDDGILWTDALEAVTGDGFIDAVFAKNEKERAALWAIRDEWPSNDRLPTGIKYDYDDEIEFDVSVPIKSLPALIDFIHEAPTVLGINATPSYVGHLIDGNIHLSYQSETNLDAWAPKLSEYIITKVKQLSGSFSAEHGIGAYKREWLERYGDPGHISLMRTIKLALDPKGILNPGKVLEL